MLPLSSAPWSSPRRVGARRRERRLAQNRMRFLKREGCTFRNWAVWYTRRTLATMYTHLDGVSGTALPTERSLHVKRTTLQW